MRAFTWAWLLYGVCETLLAIAFPALRARLGGGAFGHHPVATLVLLPLYPLAGALLGAIAARALRVRDARAPSLALLASGSVVAALFAWQIARGDVGKSGIVLAAGFAALFALAAQDARRGEARRGTWALASPWVAVPLVVTLAWLLRALLIQAPLAQRLAACAVFAALWLGGAWRLRAAIARGWLSSRGGLRAACAALPALGALCAVLLHDAEPAFPGLPAASPGDSARTPVVLVVLDTVRADHLSVYGYARDTSPALATFARDALVFEQMTTPGDMTLTSHASLFSGLFVSHHGATVPNPVLGETTDTLAERLARAGYTSYGIAANCGWLGPGHGLEQGFAHWDPRCGRALFAGVAPVFLRAFVLGSVRSAFFREQAGWRWRSAQEVSDEALRALAHLDAGNAPFLLFLNYMDVHRPIQPPVAYRTRYPGADPAFDMSADWSALHVEVNAGKREVTAAERAHLESQYDGAIAYIDDQLKRVFDDLRARGLLERSLVIVTSDHGEGFGDHATFGHGHGVYQDEVHGPLIVKLPGQRAGRRIGTAVSLVDVMPTVLAALGLPPAQAVDGVSLLSEIPETRALFAESVDGKGALASALRSGSRKLVRHRGRADALYDLASDPSEARDLAASQAAEASARAAELAAWLAARANQGAGATLAPDEAERLKALGYLQ
ncbi:MAG TPA: sulfatase-like hydrolase/transferase [Myxococcota bacterium]